jgi:hypothetical protein
MDVLKDVITKKYTQNCGLQTYWETSILEHLGYERETFKAYL